MDYITKKMKMLNKLPVVFRMLFGRALAKKHPVVFNKSTKKIEAVVASEPVIEKAAPKNKKKAAKKK